MFSPIIHLDSGQKYFILLSKPCPEVQTQAISGRVVSIFPFWHNTDVLLSHTNSRWAGQHRENPAGQKIPVVFWVIQIIIREDKPLIDSTVDLL